LLNYLSAIWSKMTWVLILLVFLVLGGAIFLRVSARPIKHHANAKNPDLRILFIGNSFISYNDMPAIFVSLMHHQKPQKRLRVFSVTEGGFTLLDHSRRFSSKLATFSKWDYIILQEQSTQPLNPEDAKNMEIDCVWLDKHFRVSKNKTALLMTWCDLNKPKDQVIISKVYRDIGRKLNATVIPAGELMLKVTKEEPKIPLYDSDGYHPGKYGSYLVACLICNMLGQTKTENASVTMKHQTEKDLKNLSGPPDPIERKLQKYADDFAATEKERRRILN
jgi:hypothetical protein